MTQSARFDGKIAIVTGGASGIGKAMAARFAAAMLLLAWSASVLATSQFNPFIYFRF